MAGHSPGPTDEELHAFQRGTRDLIGIALHHRSVVTLELSESGRELVNQVLAWRHDELELLLSLIDPVLRAQAAQALQQLHAAVGQAYADELPVPGPVPL